MNFWNQLLAFLMLAKIQLSVRKTWIKGIVALEQLAIQLTQLFQVLEIQLHLQILVKVVVVIVSVATETHVVVIQFITM